MSALDALLALARSFGAAGKKYTDLSYSDDFVAAVEAVEAEGRYDRAARQGVEAAFYEGLKGWRLGGGWESVWTTAPVDYDGMGTETVEGPFEWALNETLAIRKSLRRVIVDPDHYDWQTSRYPACWDEDPRVTEARIKERLAAEKAEREAYEKRRAEGLIWIRTAEIDGGSVEADNAADELARAHGLGWEDVRAERRRRHEEKAAADRLALARLHGQMAVLCRAEADAIARPYDVVRQPLTPDEREEIAHLDALGNEAADRMDRLAPGKCSGGFYAFIFDYPGGPS